MCINVLLLQNKKLYIQKVAAAYYWLQNNEAKHVDTGRFSIYPSMQESLQRR